jgi:demethylmenaquinone methyltransferase / 2-methoxy-6-polyprenyl-1,4-benzoquinol methylase
MFCYLRGLEHSLIRLTMEKETARPLQKMFQAVPPSYDLLNRLLTFRFDERWRKQAAKIILEGQPARVLDLCTGTGDLALRLKKGASPETGVWGLDYSLPMLERAGVKARKRGLPDIRFIHGDAAAMPFEDGFFDAAGIAFAFRNLTWKNPDTGKFLAEILRVLKPGGKFVVVETSQPRSRLFKALVHFYLRRVSVPLGGMISGHRGAYHYLAHSAIHYYTAEEVRQLLLDAGFTAASHRLLLNGVAGLWEATK